MHMWPMYATYVPICTYIYVYKFYALWFVVSTFSFLYWRTSQINQPQTWWMIGFKMLISGVVVMRHETQWSIAKKDGFLIDTKCDDTTSNLKWYAWLQWANAIEGVMSWRYRKHVSLAVTLKPFKNYAFNSVLKLIGSYWSIGREKVTRINTPLSLYVLTWRSELNLINWMP